MKLVSTVIKLLLGVLLALPALAEGTRELEPQNFVNRLNVVDPNNNFASFSSGLDQRLQFSVLRPGQERVYIGIGEIVTNGGPGNLRVNFRIKDPNGNVVFGPMQSPIFGQTGWIGSKGQAVAGPNVIDPNGYDPLVFQPTMAGDYTIEFSGLGGGPGGGGFNPVLRYFDLTVYDFLTSREKKGRLFSKQWALITDGFQTPSYGKFYIYTPDSIVTALDFNGMRPYGYTVMCNRTGVINTGNPAFDRQSVDGLSVFPEYKIFLNDPDQEIYPNGRGPVQLTAPINIIGCPKTGYCINMDLTKSANAELYLELNGIAGYQEFTRDRKLEVVLNQGANCVTWDGKDGFGITVPAGTTLPVRVSVIAGLTNFPIYDAENNDNGTATPGQGGLIVTMVRPVGQTVSVFWDDTRLPFGTANLTGCAGACHYWTNDFGNERTINTWWYTGKVDVNLVYNIIENCPIDAREDFFPLPYNSPAYTANVLRNDADPDVTFDSLSLRILQGPKRGTAVVVNKRIVYTPNVNSICNDTVKYRVSDFGPTSYGAAMPVYSDSAIAVFQTLPPNPTVTTSTYSICRGQPLPTFNVQSNNGFTLRWYLTPTGGTPAAAASSLGINTSAVGTILVYVAQSNAGAACESARQMITLNVTNLPDASFSGLPPVICALNVPVTLTPAVSGGSFSGPFMTGNVFRPTVAGTYVITYNLSLSPTCTNSSSRTVTVENASTGSFTIPKTGFCVGDPGVTLTPTVAGGTFSGTGVSGTTFTPPPFAGVFNVTYTINTSSGCSATSSQAITVSNRPDPAFAILGIPQGSICLPTTSTYTLMAVTPGGTFKGPGVTGTTWSPTAAGAGMHSIWYVVANGGCRDSSMQFASVSPASDASFTLPATICVNEPPVAMNPVTSGGTFTGPGVSGTSFDPATAGVGIRTVTYTVTGANGCSGTASRNITVLAAPDAGFSGLAGTFVCIPTTTTYPLTPNTPGGTFSGPGMVGNVFQPNLAGAGTHTLTYKVTSANGCTDSSSRTIVVNQTPQIVINGLSFSFCTRSAPVTLNATPAGGVWSGPGVTGNVFDPAAAGAGFHNISYSFTNPCFSTATQVVEVRQQSDASFAGLPDSVCVTDAPITLTPVQAGGTFDGVGVTVNTFNPALAPVGTIRIRYIVGYTTGTACPDTVEKFVQVFGTPNASFSGLNASYCSNERATQLVPVVPGGTFSGPGVVGDTFSAALAGAGIHNIRYRLTIDRCTREEIKVIEVKQAPDASFTGVDTAVCIIGPPHVLVPTQPGGTFSGPFVTGNVFQPTQGGRFLISHIITSPNGCADTVSIRVAVEEPLASNFSMGKTVFCQFDAPIELFPVEPGGRFEGPGTSVGSNFFDPIVPGTYRVVYRQTASNGCFDTTGISVTVFPTPSAQFANLDTAYCTADAPVTLLPQNAGGVFTATGGLTGGNIFDPAQAGAGTFTVTYTLTQLTGCADTVTKTVRVYQSLDPGFAGLSDRYCAGDPAVSLTATTPGGVFAIDGSPIASGQFDPATAGTFVVSYTVTNGRCITVSRDTVTVFPIPDASFTGIDARICARGQAITLSPATAGGTFTVNTVLQAGNVFTATTPGSYDISYSVTVNGCSATTQQTVVVDPAPNAAFSGLNASYCVGSPVDTMLAVQRGGTWYMNGVAQADSTFNPSVAGTFEVSHVVITPSNCRDTARFTVTVFPIPDASFTGIDARICARGQAITLSPATAGGTFTVNTVLQAGNVFTATTPGSYDIRYSVTVDGCSATTQQTVVVDPAPNAAFSGLNASYCVGSPVDTMLAVQSGGTWYVNGVAQADSTFNPSVAGTFEVSHIIITPSNCRDTARFTVTVIPYADASFTTLSPNLCTSTTPINLVPATAGGQFTVNGQPAGSSFTPSTPGLFTIRYEVSNQGCVSNSQQVVTVNARPDASYSGLPATICVNSAPFTLTPVQAGGNFISSQVQGNVFTPATVGTYTVVYAITNAAGCTDTARQTIEVLPLPDASFTTLPARICANASSFTLQPVVPGGSFSLLSGAASALVGNVLSLNQPGQYRVAYTVTGANGCPATTVQTLEIAPRPDASFTGLQTTYCQNSPASTLTPTNPGGTFSGPGINGDVFNPVQPGTYEIQHILVNNSGCADTARFTVTVFATPDASFTGLSPVLCNNVGTLTLVPATPGGSFSGTGVTGNQYSPLGVGTYTISYTVSVNGCPATSSQTVRVEAAVLADFSGLPAQICQFVPNVQLVPVNPGFGTWTGPVTSQGVLETSAPGRYDVTYTVDNGGCIQAVTQQVNILPAPNLTMPESITILPNEAARLEVSTSAVSVQWQPAPGLSDPTSFTPEVRPMETTTYKVRAYLANGCYIDGSVTVIVRQPLQAANVITPNGDGKNDALIIDNLEFYPRNEVVIINRWGQEVYRSSNYINGSWKGDDLPAAVYFYTITTDTPRVSANGWIQIIR